MRITVKPTPVEGNINYEDTKDTILKNITTNTNNIAVFLVTRRNILLVHTIKHNLWVTVNIQ